MNIFGLLICILCAQTTIVSKPKKPNLAQTVHELAKNFMEKYQIPGMAIALYKNGVSYTFPFGYADVKLKTSITEQTIFEIGSISKIFTCLLLAQEVLDGKMKLDDAVSEYISAFAQKKRYKTITMQKLATHTANLPYNPPAHVKNRKDLMEHFMKWQPPESKQFRWQYSNHGVELIAIALEEKYQKSIHHLLIDNILKPLGMEPIGITITDSYKKLSSSCYNRDGTLSTAYIDQMYLEGSGLLHASATDMLQFLKASLGLPDTPKNIKKAMQLTQMPFVFADNIKQGLGWQIDVLDEVNVNKLDNCWACDAQEINKSACQFNGNALFDKTGTTQGFHSYIAAVPNKKTGIVVLINKRLQAGFRPIKKFGREVLRKI